MNTHDKNKLHTNKTIEAYNKNSEKYADKFMNFQSYVKMIELFQKSHLKNAKTILDLGCGPGNNAELLKSKDKKYQITGVDLSEKMVQLARRTVKDASFQVGDIRNFESATSFDAVIASFCIVHLSTECTVKLIENISSLVVDGGYLYLSFMAGKEAGLETTSFSKEEIFFNYYDEEEVERYLAENSFEVIASYDDDYHETDGSITKDIFIFAQKR